MDANLKEKLSSKSKWVRFLYMLLFLVITIIVKFMLWFVAAFQFVTVLFTDHPNKMLLDFAEHLSVYIAQIFRFLSYNTETKPYPFTAWPGQTKAPIEVLKTTSPTALPKKKRK